MQLFQFIVGTTFFLDTFLNTYSLKHCVKNITERVIIIIIFFFFLYIYDL